jgi:hypothetical protein
MSNMQKRSRWLLLAAGLLVAATRVRAQDMPQTLDDQYAQEAARVPGFGGLYLDARGTTHVYLTDLSLSREVQDLGNPVVVEQGQYDYRDLYTWRVDLRPQLAQRGAVFLDIDEQRNRIVFGVESGSVDAFTANLQTVLRATGVPPEAVIVEAAEPIVELELLTNTIRPVPGGVQIERVISPTVVGICTLGTNATRAGVKGFITASHCTATRGAVDGAVFFQSTPGSTTQIGVETVDPSLFSGGSCPAGKLCRYSDAAFAAYGSASFSGGAEIANPLFWSTSVGTLLTNPSLPRLPITGSLFGSPASGAVVYKVGRTTGGTFGSVTNTCADTNVSGFLNLTYLCQTWVGAGSQGGDSGSPVFLNGGDHATLAGILWGGNGGSFVFSPWLFVNGELGGILLSL